MEFMSLSDKPIFIFIGSHQTIFYIFYFGL